MLWQLEVYEFLRVNAGMVHYWNMLRPLPFSPFKFIKYNYPLTLLDVKQQLQFKGQLNNLESCFEYVVVMWNGLWTFIVLSTGSIQTTPDLISLFTSRQKIEEGSLNDVIF